MKKILISDSIHQQSVSLLVSAGFDVKYKPGLSHEELLDQIHDYNALIVRSSTQVDAELISAMKNMQIIGRAGTGIDNIDVNTATRKGILVMNTPGGNTISAAEHTMALILSMCRNIPQSHQSLQNKKWDRKNFSGTELFGKTLGIIGLGKIGREVALRAQSFGMNIIGFDPLLSSETAIEAGITPVNLEKIWEQSDLITVHVPLNEHTENLVNKQTLKLCKKGVKIINCARGGIVSESDLLDALDNGFVSSAALDVYQSEPPDFSSRIFSHPKIVCTPHLGASTEEAQEKVAIQIADQIIKYLNENRITGSVNLRGFYKPVEAELLPYLKLGEKLGSFLSQIFEDNIRQLTITLSGKMLHKIEQEISASIIKSFLDRRLSEPVNYVNAFSIIDEMGISLRTSRKAETKNYTNTITVEVNSENSKKMIAGTVFGANEPRIVQIDQYHLEVKASGNMIIYKNIDKPGMLASVGKILAEAEINIAGLSLGRIEKGEDALTVINIDTKADNSILNKISSINGIIDIHSVGIDY